MSNDTQSERLRDYITGQKVPNRGAEVHRQYVERHLVEALGFTRDDLQVDFALELEIAGQTYRSSVDLVACIDGAPLMAVKCVATSLASCEREICAAARLLPGGPARFAVASNGETALVWDVWEGHPAGEGLQAIPDRGTLEKACQEGPRPKLSDSQRHRLKLIFRTYDMANVHRSG